MKLRQRLENSDLLAAILSAMLAGYLRFCFATSRWQPQGLDELIDALKKGPVILVLWHSRLAYAPSAWPGDTARLFTLNDPSPIGRVTSAAHARLGMSPVHMGDHISNFAASRKILKVVRDGHSLGLVADGPRGPGRRVNRAPVEWTRTTGLPVFLFAWSARRSWRLNTWDRILIPLPFARGTFAFRRWPVEVPKKLDQAGLARIQAELAAALDRVTRDMDLAAGKPPED